MRRLCILYGTQTGTAEGVALRIARLAIKRGADDVRCLPADDVPVTSWLSLDCPVLFVCSNANQGEAPDTFRNTWRQLLQPPRVPSSNNNNNSKNNSTSDEDGGEEEVGTPLQLTGLRYAVFGLGHAHYYKFNYMAKMLHNRLQQLQATPLLLRGLGAQSDAGGLDEVLQPWLMQLWRALGWLPPPQSSSSSLTTTEDKEDTATWPAFPLYTVRMLPPSPSPPADAQRDTAPSLYDVTAPRNEGDAMFVCEVCDNVRLTPSNYFQVVHRVQLRVVDTNTDNDDKATTRRAVSYEVGDALGVYCPNAAERVEALLRLLGVAGDVVVCVTPGAASHGLTAQPRRAFFARPMTLRYLLTHYYDLDACVGQDFFRMLAYHVPQPLATDAAAAAAEAAAEVCERLCELGDPLKYHDYLAYAHQEKRNAYDVLFDFARVRPPLDVLLSFLPVMRPRYFSLASSPLYDPLPALHLLVARLDWQTAMRRHRTGLCSSWLTDAPRGARVACFVWQGTMTMPPVPTPLLCIATGTGIAPVRSLLRQCAALARQQAAAATEQQAEDTARTATTTTAAAAAAASWGDVPIYLVFGCRHCDKDYLCADEWRQLRESNTLRGLTVLPAFSRDTSSKVYVQHVLGAHAQRVGALLRPERHAVVYVCGNAKSMPKSVLDTLQHIVQVCVCDGDDAQAHAVMRRMSLDGRYQVDTWSA